MTNADTLRERVATLEHAIRVHRDQRSDDRCWMDDQELYAVLPEGRLGDNRVGDKMAMLDNCRRFIDRRCEGGHWPTYADLERTIAELRGRAEGERVIGLAATPDLMAMVAGPPDEGRSPHWPAVQRAFVKAHPACEACGTRNAVEVHHVEPFHVRPDLELDPANLITLCRADHFCFGHFHLWSSWNANVRSDVARYRADLNHRPGRPMSELACIPKELPPDQWLAAARTACEVNPANGVPVSAARSMGLTPSRIALLTGKYWGPKVDLGVTFLDGGSAELKAKILAFANKWGGFGNIRFRESSAGQVRLSRGSGGYWSYLGTDILSISADEQTMNLEAFGLSTPDSEYDRVVCHEFGHTLGFPHEHERTKILALLDVGKTVAWFRDHVGWDRQTVMQQVFDPIDPKAIQATAPDVRSIMAYQFVGACTKSGQPIPGGDKIDATDGGFAAKVYPPDAPPPVVSGKSITFGMSFKVDIDPAALATVPLGKVLAIPGASIKVNARD